ncbi:MAG: AAA family ATPase [Flavisolibacter sp.]
MIKNIILSGLLLFCLPGIAQKPVPQNWLKKITPSSDSLPTKERQRILTASLSEAGSQRKNILVFSPSAKTTKDKDALFIRRSENKEIYKVNIPMVVSDKISETEKNLDRLFTEAGRNSYILFFDEAGDLFSRTGQAEVTMNYIQSLAQSKNVITIFWCEEDCLKWLKKGSYVLVK